MFRVKVCLSHHGKKRAPEVVVRLWSHDFDRHFLYLDLRGLPARAVTFQRDLVFTSSSENRISWTIPLTQGGLVIQLKTTRTDWHVGVKLLKGEGQELTT